VRKLNAVTEAGYPLWDLPTRIFHWSLVVAIPLAWWSAENENYSVHEWTGYTIIVLVVSRIAWGFLGSRHSRFRDFLAGPGTVLDYVKGKGPNPVGHNPLGGWSVMALLALLLMQGVSGLFNSDDVLFSGPFYYAAEGPFRDTMGVVHELAFNTLLGLVVLHILAVLYHQLHRGEKLIQAMLRGRVAGREGEAPPKNGWVALAILVVAATLLWWAISRAPQPVPVW
jgi:cytochrome b